MSPQLIAGLVLLFLTTLIAVLGYLVRVVVGTGENVKEIKTVLGINGHPAVGLVPEVERLRDEVATVDKRIMDSRHMVRNEIFERFDDAVKRTTGTA